MEITRISTRSPVATKRAEIPSSDISYSLSLSLSVPFSRAFRASKYFLDREISVGFFDAMFEIFAKFEARFAQLVQSRVNLKVWEK